MLPNFFCVGATKSGTTSLHDILTIHPQIYLPTVKETTFFWDDRVYNKGIKYYEETFFSQWNGEKAIGEIDPSCMHHFDLVPGRMLKCFGRDLKLIFILRNPVDRAYSHYNMSCNRGIETESFLDAIKLETIRINEAENEIRDQNSNSNEKAVPLKVVKAREHYSYISRGYYGRQVRRFIEKFGKDNMIFIIFEEFISNQTKSIDLVLDFLEVDKNLMLEVRNTISNPSAMIKNKWMRMLFGKPTFIKNQVIRPLIPTTIFRRIVPKLQKKLKTELVRPPKLDYAVRKNVMDIFLDDIHDLESIINKDLSIWYGNS